MIDFTPDIKLEPHIQKRYRNFRFLLFVLAFFFFGYTAYLVLFPAKYLFFDFLNPRASSNNLIDPRDESGNFIDQGKLVTSKTLFFDAVASGTYSDVAIQFNMDQKILNENIGKIEIRKAYRAFLYPDGDPLGFRDGSLVRSKDNYYLVSNQHLRRFLPSALNQLGFQKEFFTEVAESDLAFNLLGEEIRNAEDYPESSLFVIDDVFYMLKDNKLFPFVSRNAYLSRYREEQAISKDEKLFDKYPLGKDQIGFSDGSLVAYGDSAFIISGKDIHPIDNPTTFESKGFVWDDIIPVSGEEIAIYEKQGLFNINKAHPDGVVLEDRDKKIWYQVAAGKKLPILSQAITRTWLSKSPVIVSSASLDIVGSCDMQRRKLLFKTAYACAILIDNMQHLPGAEYEFNTSLSADLDISTISTTFKKDVSISNLKLSLRNILTKIMLNYGLVEET